MGIIITPSEDLNADQMSLLWIEKRVDELFSLEEYEGRPRVRLLPSEEGGCSVVLLTRFFSGVERFFYEMVSKWLIPEKTTPLQMFFFREFQLEKNMKESLAFCEASFLCSPEELEEIIEGFFHWEADICQGAVSLYQANRILESRSQFSSDKRKFIQEKISLLLQKRPQNFDYDIFGQMQHFFAHATEDFMRAREIPSLCRIVVVFYLFRRSIRANQEDSVLPRKVCFKIGKTRVHFPLGIKCVLSIFVGLNFLQPQELFGEQHLIKAIQEYIPEARLVPGSFFSSLHQEEKMQLLYMEIETSTDRAFSQAEREMLHFFLANRVEEKIEKPMPSIFMPRNEEEVMKNIVLLSQQLRYIKDVPQVFISFDEQTEEDLSFTIIFVRVLSLDCSPSLSMLFAQFPSSFLFVEDRIKNVGKLRDRYRKEATVFRMKTKKSTYIRADYSLDLLRARQDVVKEIHRVMGDFRDYNGGMIAKQIENLEAVKQLFFFQLHREELQLEHFFHSLFPVEKRSLISPLLCKKMYDFWLIFMQEKNNWKMVWEEGSGVFFVKLPKDRRKHQKEEDLKKWYRELTQALYFSSEYEGSMYLGAIVFGVCEEKFRHLLEVLVPKLLSSYEN